MIVSPVPAHKLGDAARRLLPKSHFARSVSVLAGGTAAGQIIVVAASPILTRLYSPEDFGLLAVYAGLLGILGVVASLRYQLAIPLPESDEDAASIVVLSLLVALGMTAMSVAIVWIWGRPITVALNTPALVPYLWLLPIGLFLTGIYQAFKYWAIRVNAFPAIARTKLTQALSMIGVQLGGYALGPLALLLGQLSSQAAGTSSLGFLAIGRKWASFRLVRPVDIWWVASRYRRFPIYSSWSGVFNKTGAELPAILFAVLFSPAVAGIYMLAHRVLAMPMSLLGRAISDVFFSSATKANRDGSLATLVPGIHTKLAYIAMPPALLLLLLGPDLFAFAFGNPWRQAGQFAQWMAPFLYIQFVTSPLGILHSVVEKQAQGAFFHTVLLAVRVVSLSIGGLQGDVIFAVALFSVSSAVCWFGFLLWLLSLSGAIPLRTVASSTLKAMASALLVGLPVIVAVALDLSGKLLVLATVFSVVGLFSRYYTLLRLAY